MQVRHVLKGATMGAWLRHVARCPLFGRESFWLELDRIAIFPGYFLTTDGSSCPKTHPEHLGLISQSPLFLHGITRPPTQYLMLHVQS